MAEAVAAQSLSEQYHLEKEVASAKPVEVKEVVPEAVTAQVDEVKAAEEPKEESPVKEAVSEVVSPVKEAVSEVVNKVEEKIESPEDKSEAPAAEEEEETPAAEETNVEDTSEEVTEETPDEIKLETAPADFRFPTTNQTRHCFTRYIEYHRCVAAKGDEAPECDKFAKFYRSLCPSEWVDRWNEQRENGTFPGPL